METERGFARLAATKKSGSETFHCDQKSIGLGLMDFWRWSASDLVSNATRGILAEYIVASALGLASGVRAEWDAFDLLLPRENALGIKIEVKSASYLQSWFHQKLSPISFSIAPTRLWDAGTNAMSGELKHQADVYVFCLLGHRIKAAVDQHDYKMKLDLLDLDEWKFYVLPTSVLDAKIPAQKTIGLASLKKLDPRVATYETLGERVRESVS